MYLCANQPRFIPRFAVEPERHGLGFLQGCDRHPRIRLLPAEDDVVADLVERSLREVLILHLRLLYAQNIRPLAGEPILHKPYPAPDRVRVVRRYLEVHILSTITLWKGETPTYLKRKPVRNLGMTRNCFHSTSCWINPQGMRSPFTFEVTPILAEMLQWMSRVSLNLDRFLNSIVRNTTQAFLATVLKYERNCIGQVVPSFFLRLPLSVSTWDLRTVCDVPLAVTP